MSILSVSRRIPEPTNLIDVDLFIRSVDAGSAEFVIHKDYSSREMLVRCKLYCKHRGNSVFASADAILTGEAFLAAVEQMEKTIGSSWRNGKR